MQIQDSLIKFAQYDMKLLSKDCEQLCERYSIQTWLAIFCSLKLSSIYESPLALPLPRIIQQIQQMGTFTLTGKQISRSLLQKNESGCFNLIREDICRKTFKIGGQFFLIVFNYQGVWRQLPPLPHDALKVPYFTIVITYFTTCKDRSVDIDLNCHFCIKPDPNVVNRSLRRQKFI